MAWLIFFAFWLLFLWLYKHSEKNKRLRGQLMQKDKESDYSEMKRDFDESMELFNGSEDFKERLRHIERAIEILQEMEETQPGGGHFEEKLPQLLSLKQALIYSDIKEQYEKSLKNARESTSLISRINYATNAQSILREGLNLGLDEMGLAAEIKEANNFIQRIQYDEYLAKAKKEEERGNMKKAIDQCQVALYFLKTSSLDKEEQASLIEKLEKKIEDLYKIGGISEGGS